MQAYIKHKAYYDKKTNASKLKKQQKVYYVLQPEADHQRSKNLVTDFRCIGPYVVENASSNNVYSVRKVGSNRTQVLHHMKLRPLTPRQPIPDVQTTWQDWKFNTGAIIKHPDLYAKASESEYERLIFDNRRR